jgi:two-component system OmpR family response regulator
MNRDHVLIVDDDYVINLELHEFLQDSGFTVKSVYSAATAFAALKRHPPWALVTDLDLGAGRDGFDVARYARGLRPGMPVVFVSGTMADRHVREGVAGSDFIPKPCQGRQIVEALHRAIRLEVA